MLKTDLRHDVVQSFYRPLAELGPSRGRRRLRFARGGRRPLLEAEGIDAADRYVARSADMRYVGQEYTVNVLVDATISLDQIDAEFHEVHRTRYGHATPGAPVEFVNLRLAALGRIATAETMHVGGAEEAELCSGCARSCSTA